MFGLIVVSVVLVFSGATFGDPDCSQPPPRENFVECCAKPGQLDEIKKECLAEFPFEGRFLNFCFGECIFNKMGLLENNEIQIAKAPTIYGNIYKDTPEFVPVAMEALKKCNEMGQTKLAKIMERKPEAAEKCHPLPAIITRCMFMETFLNCPDSMWKNTDACNSAREHVKACPPPPRPPPKS